MTDHTKASAGPEVGPVDVEIARASLAGIVQEMQNLLFRTGYSTIIRESHDASCAITDSVGNVVAQHIVLPLHIGAFPACAAAILRAYGDDLRDGDAFLINHPYEGGSPHAPDMAVLAPIFADGTFIGFCGSIAHKSDIGGPVPGSCSGQAKETFNEGLHLPAVRYQRGFARNLEIERIIAANSRTPELVLGDIRGQLGCVRIGVERVGALSRKLGRDHLLACFERLLENARTRLRAGVAEWTDGACEAERFVDDDGIDLEKPVRIHVSVRKVGDNITFDFSKSADQTRGPANIRPSLVRAACLFCLVSLIDPHMTMNSGSLAAFNIVLRPGSVLDPQFPAPVNTYNPTVHALVESVFAAMAQIAPGRGRADGCGGRSIIFGGRGTSAGKAYVQYELFGGGGGARSSKDGVSGTMVNQANGKVTPIEIIESEFAARLTKFELIPDSGGAGAFRGGLGFVREYVNLADARFSIRSSKHVIPPEGAAGGKAARTGDIRINPGTEREKRLPTRYADYPVVDGDIVRLETPGGGGFGDPLARDPALVLADVRAGYVTREGALSMYGVVFSSGPEGAGVDAAKTLMARKNLRAEGASREPANAI